MMETTDLIQALCKVQQELKPVLKNQEADIGRFKYAYADLSQVLEQAMPILNKHGIALIQTIENDRASGHIELHTILAHTSGQNITSKAPLILKENTPQALGSAITYMRRYSLMAMIGMVAQEEDDDGAVATRPIQTPQRQTPPPQAIPNLAPKAQKPLIQPSNPDIKAKVEGVPRTFSGPSEKQIKRFFAIAKSRGWTDQSAMDYVDTRFKKPIQALNKDEYEDACNWVQNNSPTAEATKLYKKELDNLPPFDRNEPMPGDDDIPF